MVPSGHTQQVTLLLREGGQHMERPAHSWGLGWACEPRVGRDGAGEIQKAGSRGLIVHVNCGDFHSKSR